MEKMQTDASVKGITEVYQQFSLETFSKGKKMSIFDFFMRSTSNGNRP